MDMFVLFFYNFYTYNAAWIDFKRTQRKGRLFVAVEYVLVRTKLSLTFSLLYSICLYIHTDTQTGRRTYIYLFIYIVYMLSQRGFNLSLVYESYREK